MERYTYFDHGKYRLMVDGVEYSNKFVDRLAHYEDLEEQGRLVILPCNENAELERDGEVFEADHWNHTLTAFRDEPSTRSGKQVALFSIQEAEAALARASGASAENQ